MEIEERDTKIARLQKKLEKVAQRGDETRQKSKAEPTTSRSTQSDFGPRLPEESQYSSAWSSANSARGHRGKAPPIDYFTGEDPGVPLREWLPLLRGAADWNEWSNEETFIQLAGYLKGRALQEWELLDDEYSHDWLEAVKMLQNRLEHGQHSMAAQEFKSRNNESVSDFIVRLERTFRIAYGIKWSVLGE